MTFHGCEKDLAPSLGAHFEVECGGHTNACYNVSKDDFVDEFLTSAKACFCEGERCNINIPDLPMPTPDTPTPTPSPSSGEFLSTSILTYMILPLLVFMLH